MSLDDMDFESQLIGAEAVEEAFSFMASKLGIVRLHAEKNDICLAIWVFKVDGDIKFISYEMPNFARACIQILWAIRDVAKRGTELQFVTIEEATEFVETRINK